LASTTLVGTCLSLWSQPLEGGTDMPAIGWTYAGLAMLMVHVRRPHVAWTMAAGGLLGLGYMVRYSVLPLALMYPLVLLLAPVGDRRAQARYALAFAGSFLIAAAPQLVITAQEHWNPFWNRQDINVYFGMFGGQNWGHGWAEANDRANGIVALAVSHPGPFLHNIVNNPAYR
jgi:hypothetical protein